MYILIVLLCANNVLVALHWLTIAATGQLGAISLLAYAAAGGLLGLTFALVARLFE